MFRVREDIIDFFKKGIFLFKGNVFKSKEERSKEKIKKSINDGIIFIKEKSRDVNNDLLNKYFDFQHLLIWQINYIKQKMQRKTAGL